MIFFAKNVISRSKQNRPDPFRKFFLIGGSCLNKSFLLLRCELNPNVGIKLSEGFLFSSHRPVKREN